MTPTNQLKAVLERAWTNPFKTKSNFARTRADEVAAAASAGLITVESTALRTYGTTWLITKQGLELLNEFYR